MPTDAELFEPSWRPLAASIVAALGINIAAFFLLSIVAPGVFTGAVESNLLPAVEIVLSPPRDPSAKSEEPLKEPEPFARAFVIQNNLPMEMFTQFEPDPKKPNGLLDREEGGSALRPEGVRSGGGGGAGIEALAAGHAASDERVWARMKLKRDPSANEVASADENGGRTTMPGVLKNSGSVSGLGNGIGAGALASQGSGTGSGAGADGSNIGQGLGKAAPVGVSRKPGVLSMNRGGYPAEARAARHEGTVVLSVEVLPGGEVGRVDVRTSSGYSELDDAAMNAAKGWRFTGALQDGEPVAFWYAVPYRFVLTER